LDGLQKIHTRLLEEFFIIFMSMQGGFNNPITIGFYFQFLRSIPSIQLNENCLI